MKKLTLSLATIISLSLSPIGQGAFAQERTDSEKNKEAIGFGSGAVAGALIAGPVGAIIGGAFGVLVADDINDENRLEKSNTALAAANTANNTMKSELGRQKRELLALQSQYENALKQNQIELVSLNKEIERVIQEVEANIQFRTASYLIEDHFKSQLDLVAKGLADNPQLVVSLSGFADARGDSTYNQALSEQRVISVKDYLIDKGVSEKQVLTNSFGESQSVITAKSENEPVSNEDHFFDRRVLVRIAEGQQAMTASNY